MMQRLSPLQLLIGHSRSGCTHKDGLGVPCGVPPLQRHHGPVAPVQWTWELLKGLPGWSVVAVMSSIHQISVILLFVCGKMISTCTLEIRHGQVTYFWLWKVIPVTTHGIHVDVQEISLVVLDHLLLGAYYNTIVPKMHKVFFDEMYLKVLHYSNKRWLFSLGWKRVW